MKGKQRSVGIALTVLILIFGGLLYRAWSRSQADQTLLVAVRTDDADRALAALNAGADPNLRGYRVDMPQGAPWEEWLQGLGFGDRKRRKPGALNSSPTMLMLACGHSGPQLVHALLVKGADPNLAQSSGETPLIHAAIHGDLEVVKDLLDHGAKDDRKAKNGSTALSCAISFHHPDAALELIRRRAGVDTMGGPTATLEYVLKHDADDRIVKSLLEAGADAAARSSDGRPMLVLAAVGPIYSSGLPHKKNKITGPLRMPTPAGSRSAFLPTSITPTSIIEPPGRVRMLRALLEHGAQVDAADHSSDTALMRCAANGEAASVRLLLDHHASVTARDLVRQTALHNAASSTNAAVIRLLLDRHAEIDAQDKSGRTPLIDASDGPQPYWTMQPDSRVLKQLLAYHPAIDRSSRSGDTALLIAARNGYLERVQLLLAAGADPDHRNAAGETPLIAVSKAIPLGPTTPSTPAQLIADMKHRAAPFLEIVRMLLAHHVNPTSQDIQGRSALTYAKQHQGRDLIDLLKKAGAR